ncbi:MAG: hypothetical protein U1E51_34545 [Candidatus Binatia bacterium]|nr:hypothetical protein [Candidatus Binatia bacterium]
MGKAVRDFNKGTSGDELEDLSKETRVRSYFSTELSARLLLIQSVSGVTVVVTGE